MSRPLSGMLIAAFSDNPQPNLGRNLTAAYLELQDGEALVAVNAPDHGLAAHQGAVEHDHAVALHHSGGHGHGAVSPLGEGAYPCLVLLVQGNERLSNAQQARELRGSSQRLRQKVNAVAHGDDVPGEERLSCGNPLAANLHLRCVARREALVEAPFGRQTLDEAAHRLLLAGDDLYDVPAGRLCALGPRCHDWPQSCLRQQPGVKLMASLPGLPSVKDVFVLLRLRALRQARSPLEQDMRASEARSP